MTVNEIMDELKRLHDKGAIGGAFLTVLSADKESLDFAGASDSFDDVRQLLLCVLKSTVGILETNHMREHAEFMNQITEMIAKVLREDATPTLTVVPMGAAAN